MDRKLLISASVSVLLSASTLLLADPVAKPAVTPATAAGTAPLTAPLVQEPVAAAADPAPDANQNRPPAEDGAFQHRGPGGLGGGGRQFTEEEITKARPKAVEFMQKYSPERYKAMQTLEPARKKSLEDFMVRMYLGWQRMQPRDADLYAVVVSRVQLEDKIFGLVGEIHKQTDPQTTEAKALNTKLHDTVASLVDVNTKERQLRLDRLAATLKEQQEKLTQDQDPARRDAQIEERLKAVMNEKQMFPAPGGRGNRNRDERPQK